MSAARRSRGSRTHQAPPASASARLTSRGAIAILFVVSLLGILISDWFDQSWACGLMFVIGCVAVCLWVRPSDTPMLAVAPPLVYFVALLAVELFTGLMSGKFLQVAAIGIALNLSAGLFWLLGGTALSVLILWFRGLPAAWAEFRADLRGERHDEDEPEPAPYGSGAGHDRQAPPMPRRPEPAPPYPGGQSYQGQRPPGPAPAPRGMPPRPPRPQQWNAPRPEAPPPRGYPPRRGGYPPQPGGYR